jgi:NitT/TauT family transport system permease protein
VQRFRLEDVPGINPEEPLMALFIRESRLLRWIKVVYRRYNLEHREPVVAVAQPAQDHSYTKASAQRTSEQLLAGRAIQKSEHEAGARGEPLAMSPSPQRKARPSSPWRPVLSKALQLLLTWGLVVAAAYGSWRLLQVIAELSWGVWVVLIRNSFWSLMRVFASLFLSTLWTVPAGIWIGTNPRRIRIAQPIIQILASFPAPMLYPLALALFFGLGVNFDWGSMFLLMLGTQWYVLFNVLAGALRIPQELTYATALMKTSTFDRWWKLYIPSVFPALVTGWVTAAGGAWNATIVAEYIAYKGKYLQTSGLGATISMAATSQDMPVLAASLTLMVIIVILLNRAVWSRVYELANTRYRMDQ